MKSSSDGSHVKIENRRPLFTSNKISAEKVDIQNEPRVHLVAQPERKRSRIHEPVSSNVYEKKCSDINQGKDLLTKPINQGGTVTDNKTQNVKQTACTETQSLRPDFQRKVVLNSEGCLNVRRKRSNKRNLTVTSDYDKASSDRKDILDDELLWLPTVSNSNDSCASMRMDDNRVVETCTDKFSQDSFTDLFASSTSTPLSTPQSNVQHSLQKCSGTSFLDLLDDDLKLAELDVSGIISSYNSACNKLEKETLQAENNDLMNLEIKKTKSNTACKTFKLSQVEKYPKIAMNTLDKPQINDKSVKTNMCDEMYNSSLSKLLHESDQKVMKQVDTNVGINIQNELDSSSKTIGTVNDEMKNGCQANDAKASDEQFYGLSLRVGSLIKKHKGIEKLYDWQNDCLNLPAVRKQQNLIYSLPTSGGKTLVAEILIMKELLCQEKDALLILPFVSIVQEKVRDMSLFAVDLEFLVEEYAASKGKFPPRKRRKKKSLYIATIEKANGLVNSLIEDNRISEIGLVVVDEIHMLGEGGHRGATLEMCLAKILFCSGSTQVIGMSATLNNIEDLQQFLNAEKYINEFRPVKLKEYIKVENEIFEVKNDRIGRNEEIPLRRSRKVKHESTDPTLAFNDPDHLSVLAQEVIPKYSCLVFCPTKLNCQNVAKLLAKSLSGDLKKLKVKEKHELLRSLKTNADGICPVLRQVIPYGIAYHHGGLTMDERKLIEEAYSQGTLCLLTCTSTLAAGVNLPAKRVILRNPYVGKNLMTRSQYKQMIGRAGRAGIDTSGESIMIVDKRDKDKVLNLINASLESCHSSLLHDNGQGLRSLVLSLIGLKVCNSMEDINRFTLKTLLAVQNCSQGNKTLLEKINENVDALVKLRLVTKLDSTVNNGTTVEATPLGRATFKACLMETWFTIVIKDVGDIPFNMSLTSSAGQQSYPDDHPTVNENSELGTTVGTLISLDQDAGDNLGFALDDDAGGRFSINSTVDCHNETSDPKVKTVCSTELFVNGSLDYEDVPSHEIIVEVSDGNHTIVSNFTVTLIDQNDSPQNVTIRGSLTGRVKENSNDELIGELVTSDEDESQSHVYSLKDARFAIKGNRLYTSPEANLNYEEQQEFEIVVVSTDNGRPQLSVQQNLTIMIEDVNEPPNNITLSSSNIRENSQQGTFVANVTIDDPDNHGPKGVWQTHSCQLVDSAQNRFKIAATSNTLLVSSGDLNYESSSSHRVILRCSDSSSKPLSIQKSFLIQILDVNERPEQITLSNAVVPENGGPLFVGELRTLDPDNAQSFNYSLVSASGENVFYINGSQLKTDAGLDYEERDLWDLKIISVDQGGLNTSQDFRITVTDTNDQPTNISTSIPLAVSENSNLGSSVAVFTAVDEDAGQTHRFLITNVSASGYGSSLAGYQTAFELDPTSGKLIVASDIDYETVTQFSLGIMTQDNGHPQFTFNKTFILNVLDINEPPTDLTLDNSQITENSPKDFFVGNLSVKDPDNINGDKQFYTCKVMNDVPFKVSQMQLLVAKPVLDFENRSDYSVKINCTQKGNSSFYIYRSFPVKVTDVNEAPYDLVISNGTSVKENEPVHTPVETLRASDQDPKDTITFEFADGSDDSSNFYINGSTLRTSARFNYEEKSSYIIDVVAKDDGTPSLNETKQFEIKIIDRNDEPVQIRFNSSGVEENAVKRTPIGNFMTDDPDKKDTHVYTLLDRTLTFYIDGDELKVNNSDYLDYEKQTKVVILVRTTDNGVPPLSIQENITVTILDSNDKPSAIKSNSTLSVDENTQGNTSIVFEVVDEDVGQSHTCHVENPEFFYINNTNNRSVLWVNGSAVLDHETNSSISIMVNCSDNGDPPLSINRTFDITIKDVNEAPVNIFLNGSHEVDEIAHLNYSLGDLICVDPDENQACSFQVLGEYNDTFNVKTGENLLTVVSNTKLDYEKLDSPNISVTIEATDDGDPRLSLIKKLSVTVDETNEGASEIILNPDNIVLKETSPAGTNISELTCNNPEKWQTLHYELFSYQNIFKIVKVPYSASFDPPILTASGQKQGTFALYKSFLFLNETFPNHDISANYDILVGVTDNGEPPSSFNGTVFVNVSRVDPCLPVNNCSANATCSRIDGFVYQCECEDGFTGDGYNCTEIDDCLNSTQDCDSAEENEVCTPCKNNATCIDKHLTYSCICSPGFNGTQCRQNIDECNPENFNYSCNEEHSTCKDGINNITCDCNRGFEDWLCNTNIDDCASGPCGDNGLCIDYTGSYQCNCRKGYTGSRCERHVGGNEIQCQDGQVYVPFPSKEETGDPESEDTEVQENSASQDVCFSAKNVTTLYFDTELIETLRKGGVRSINDVVVSAMRAEIEDWLKKVIQVWYYYADSFTEEGMYNLSDISVLDDVKVNANNISVSVIARVGHKALSKTGFLCSLSQSYPWKNCSNKTGYPEYTSKSFSFIDYLCPTEKDVEKLECKTRAAAAGALSGNTGKKLPKWSIYLLGSVGAALFVFVLLFACYADRSQKSNLQQALRSGQQYDHVRLPEEDDEHYRDVMFRHHVSTSASGEVNPIYVLDEDEEQAEMMPNPLYGMSRGIESPQIGHAKAFANPLYSTMERESGLRAKPIGEDEDSSDDY